MHYFQPILNRILRGDVEQEEKWFNH